MGNAETVPAKRVSMIGMVIAVEKILAELQTREGKESFKVNLVQD